MTDTPERLQQIRERAEAATEGPWKVSAKHGHKRAISTKYGGLAVVYADPDSFFEDPTGRDNAEFIAHACSDVPYLLSLVEEIKELMDGWERAYPTDIFPEPPERPDGAKLVWVDPDTGEKLSEPFAMGRISAAMGRFMADRLDSVFRDAALQREEKEADG